jgi:hypothetical protein
MVVKEFTTGKGETVKVEILGESREYLVISSAPNWDKGIPL